ncbi:hypothetical protein L2C91_11515 [Rosenbergiella epipactidis]|uniref:hypothetical protein n=1 Tax=Rosenbergiella epipactidis TaxID=1544694 RepID=UPI002027635B|nr:hypothetical protein [Rosenbergiella epipactidis]MCL9668990.1 hypothetical protein [Rosenbergiella epipactidis]
MSMPSTNNYGYRPTNKFSIKPNQLRFALYATAVVFGAFGKVIAPGGSGVVIGSQSSHRLTVDVLSQKPRII